MSDAPHKLGHELFLDRTSSKRLINTLSKAGFVFKTIFDVYPHNEHENVVDPEWIAKCGENNWIVITGDKRIETVPENRQAVIDARAKVFLLNDSNSKPEVWAAAIILGQYKMQDIIDATTGPFFATIGKRCDTHIQRPRRPVGYVMPATSVGEETPIEPRNTSTPASSVVDQRVNPVDETNANGSENNPTLPFS